MGLEETGRVQGPAPWAGGTGLNNARSRPEERQPRLAGPSEARTPQEALSYIEQLYQSGHMEDLAALLRRRSVFRVAWLIMQQSSPRPFKAAAGENGPGNFEDARGPVNMPVPYPTSPAWAVDSESGPAEFKAVETGFAAEAPASSPDTGITPGLLLVGKPNRLLIAALQAYQSQDRMYARHKEPAPKFSLRV